MSIGNEQAFNLTLVFVFHFHMAILPGGCATKEHTMQIKLMWH